MKEMSLDAFFKSLSMTNAVRDSDIKGVTEICPANASFQIKFDPDQIHPDDMLAELKKLEGTAESAEKRMTTRIIEIPVYYNDPWTHETLMRFRERHQDPSGTDLEYAAKINGFDTVEQFIEAHHSNPWFVSMVGFVSGLPFLYQLVDRERQIAGAQVPAATHGHAQADGRVRRLFLVHLLGARRRRLPDVRDHPDADLRPGTEDQLSQGFHGFLQAGRHREMEADRSRRIRPHRWPRSRRAPTSPGSLRSSSIWTRSTRISTARMPG
jgi:allophanate hydrolase subunit 1